MSSYLAPSSLPSGSVNSGHRVVNGHVARFFGLAKWLALLLLSVVPPTVGANPPDSWVIGDVVIEDSELFDEDYLRDRASESMTAVIDDISIEFVDDEPREIEVGPVAFSDLFVPRKRFLGFPVICGHYQLADAPAPLRYVYLGSDAFTFVEKVGQDFTPTWKRYCESPRYRPASEGQPAKSR